MIRSAGVGFFVTLLTTTSAVAQPLPWTYFVNFQAADGADAILLGSESNDGTPVSVVFPAKQAGWNQNGFELPVGTTDLFAFSYGDWEVVGTPPPPNTVANRFVLPFGFNPHGPGMPVSGSVEGTISADGVFTSGTGNFTIGVDGRAIELGGAAVQFGMRESESYSVITMTVTPNEVPVIETPEPATLLLAGVGLAGAAWLRMRRK